MDSRITPLRLWFLALVLLVVAGCAAPATATPTPTVPPTKVADTPVLSPTAALVPSPTGPSSTLDSRSAALPSLAELIAGVQPAVVAISVERIEQGFFGPIRQRGAGSGFFFDPRGYILTNNHVVQGAQRITVTLSDTRQFQAELVGRDPLTDLAVIKLPEPGEYPALPLGDSDAIRIGDWVVAIGNALALPGGPTVTLGVVGAKGRDVPLQGGVILRDMIQTDAAINPGNSGGPLINLNGEVVGINTAAAGGGAQGIGFAIGSNTAKEVARQLVEHGRVIWPWLGVFVETITPQIYVEEGLPVKEGVIIRGLNPSGPAAKADLRPGDIITAINGEPTPDTTVLGRQIRSYDIGATVDVTILRDGRKLTVPVTLEEMPRPQ